ncbi:mitogen-activated protein kinase kinase kinase 15 [Oncorhynchus kisutch]|uniref:mitogen-activated protein kinase kinase kinase 15 n=1 Tax=Oncorhynchus kisutch TaxID=8019 RepID=UPI0012DDC183|nr:mitogen-activated protein kinase kinase kinase 15 [Oncorhynchus kisutch]
MDTAGQSVPATEAGGEGRGGGGESREGMFVGSVDRENVSSPSPSTKQRSLRAVYVLNDGLKAVLATSPESGALQCLQRACDAESALLTTVTFGRLDFGETSVLDTFYDADIAVVDMSDVFRQPSLFYHLGVRESFDMANNVILYHDTDPDTALSLKDMVAQKNTASRTQTLGFPWVQLPPEYRGSGLRNKVGTATNYPESLLRFNTCLCHRGGQSLLSLSLPTHSFVINMECCYECVCVVSYLGTLQYMAPEIIDKGPRGYGAPADIWSLGCTIIEMATGKPPFHELGEPQAAMFKVGMFKIHPEIPESLSLEAKSFILRCFEPDPNKRATASDLLKDIFVRHNVKGKKSKIAFKPSDYIRSVSLPVQLQCEATGSSSSEPGSVSPDCDSKQDVFFQKNKRSGSENLLKPPSNNYLSVPDEGSVSEDRSSPASLEDRDGGLFLLKKDSERRAILYKVLNEDQDKVISNLLENHIQGSEELQLSVDHIKQIICILRDFIHSPERRVMATTISKLKLDLDFDSTSINQIQLVLFGFQDSVNKVLRNHHIKPHWMFAMDNIIRRAVQAAVTILIPELQTHFGPASESEGPDKEEEEEEEEAEFGPVLVTPPDDPAVTPEPVVTSAVSTLSSTISSPPPPPRSQPLGAQLGRLKQETNRLLEELLHREREYQQVLKTTLQQRQHDLELVRVRYRPPDVPPPSIFQVPVDHEPDKQLTDWLKDQSADADTIDKFVMEEYTLSDVLNDVTKEDLRYLRLRGGVLCRIWRGIQRHRERERLTRDDSKDDG